MSVMPRANSDEEYAKWFKDADKNKDGFLNSKEVKKLFKSKGYKTKSKIFKEQFAQLDLDGDKKVSLQEYVAVMGAISQDKHRSLCSSSYSDSFDSDSSDDDVTVHSSTPDSYQKWFNDADKNKDGHLTSKELKAMFKTKGYKMSSKAFKSQFSTLDTDGDKKVTLKEYMVSMGQIPATEHKQAMTTSGSLVGNKDDHEKWFKDADKNNDGFLSSKEVKKMLKAKGVKTSRKSFKAKFAVLDSDKDKKVSLEEYLASMGQIAAGEKSSGAAGSSHDDPLAPYRPKDVAISAGLAHTAQSKDRSDSSSDDERPKIPPAKEAEYRAKFKEADKNGDGVLDLEEMKALLQEIHGDKTNKQLFDLMHKADRDGSGLIDYEEFLILWLKEKGVLDD